MATFFLYTKSWEPPVVHTVQYRLFTLRTTSGSHDIWWQAHKKCMAYKCIEQIFTNGSQRVNEQLFILKL